ncbi:MAG TPA: NrfD/PsrC family molybdoenzyme membrane anchor subunit [Dyella sp.]|uniref:NrfD/PsrC family molybdoenzyme membrane anchor subunit n=1 Tax=Dyella sp. TaxID=1869338 RepID=UPI002BA58165|nr:NrfD/PsrC family molybdoenzyme membrane anchor subunit [Dyella sp.]HUB88200.1 NrfD/PsrC family molybdoenzyme membrane anchor subunit [Dyella sp.]
MSTPIRPDEPVLKGPQTYTSITEKVGAIAFQPNGLLWFVAFAGSLLLTLLFMAGIGELFTNGVGIWGINIPVAWGFALINYVWWIAIGMAGTFISGALYLTRQKWRSSLNRYAEAMTVFAVAVSGLFPIFHLGRPFFFYWVAFYPNRMALWPQWRSSLVWDFLAIVAYLLVSIMFWYVGMLPDLGSLRDQARTRGKQIFYGLLALGWRGEARHWKRFETLNLLLAGLAVPLVFSVHSMVALDFSEGAVPGWHSTMFPPFFVAGAFFSGFAMALVLGIPMRRWLGLGDIITPRHLDNLAKMMLAAGLFVAYNYAVEFFMAFYSGDPYEITEVKDRLVGPYAWVFWTVVFCNVLTPQWLWSPRIRRNTVALFVISLLVLIGMWFERFMLIINSLFRPYLPSSFGMFYPTVWDLIFLFGSVGLFLWLFTLFVRWLPIVATFEMRKLIHELKEPG